MSRNFETIDNEIKKRVQATEHDIPVDLEKKFMQELNRMASGAGIKEKRRILSSRALAVAASILLAVFLLVPRFFYKTTEPQSTYEDEVSIDYALVDGIPADTYIVNQQDPDLTIVWVEKAPVMAQKNNDVPL
jgi:anion-transporting  ArsA/GET3 family ATPase